MNIRFKCEYRRRDLNPHNRNDYRILSPACLPIPPLRHPWSEKRDSNPRPQPWQGCALPTELFSQIYQYLFSHRYLTYSLPRLVILFFIWGQGCALPTELFSQIYQYLFSHWHLTFALPRLVILFLFGGKVVLYQLRYFRIAPFSLEIAVQRYIFFLSKQLFDSFFY